MLLLFLIPCVAEHVIEKVKDETKFDNHAYKVSKTAHHLRHDKSNSIYSEYPQWLLHKPIFSHGSKMLGTLVQVPNFVAKPFYNELLPLIGSGATDGEARDALVRHHLDHYYLNDPIFKYIHVIFAGAFFLGLFEWIGRRARCI